MRAFRCGGWSLESPADEQGRVSWRCPRCGPGKANKLRRAIGRAAERARSTRMLTLTLDSSRMTPDQLRDGGLAHARETWRKLRVSLSRRYGEAIEFIAVAELQPRGVAPHAC